MVIAVPVIQEASFETKNSAKLATSSGFPNRFIKVVFTAFFTAASGFSKAWAECQSKGVSTGPGQMALTLIFGAYSTAICFIRAREAAFEAQYAGWFGKLLYAAIEALIKIVP